MNWGPPSLTFSSWAGRIVRRAKFFRSQPDQRIFVCHVMESRPSQHHGLEAISGGRSSITCRNRIREGRLHLPARPPKGS